MEQPDKDLTLVECAQQRILEYISKNSLSYGDLLPKEEYMA